VAVSDARERPGTSATGGSSFEIRVLGPLEVRWEDRPIDVGGLKARALIARLLIDRNLVVSVDRLLDSLWSDHPGEGAEIALRSTVSRLRKRLRDAGALEDLIVTRAPGYILDAQAECTDVHRFERLVADGRQQLARHRPMASMKLLREAAEMWRGAAYSEVRDEPFARAEARRLDELLLTATEIRLDAELTMGRHGAVVGELEALTGDNPMRERLWSQRMLALYRCGRQAEALRVFQELRSILVDELGIEPGHDVTWMEEAILNQNPALDFASPEDLSPELHQDDESAEPVVSSPLTYHSHAPISTHDGPLVGREDELATLHRWWTRVQQGDTPLLLVDGDAGIGKTRLVAELARSVEQGGALVLWGRCDEDPVAPFQPFAEALGRYFDSLSADEISHMPEWRLAELSRLVLRLGEYTPPREIDLTDPDNDRFRFFGAVKATLHEMAVRSPVLLVIDDLHWANQPTLLLLRHLLRNNDGDGPVIAALYRDTDVDADHPLRPLLANLRAERALEHVHLHGLTEAAVGALVNRFVPGDASLSAQLFALTDGNPLFLDEMLRQVTDDRPPGHGEEDTPVLADLNPPEAIRELVARRVSRLPEEVIYLLQAAAVAGPECEANIVATAAELTPDQRLDALDRAVESRLLRRVGESGERYVFSHALVRDAIYGELLRGRRVRYHHKIAVAMERAHVDAADTYVNELAHHFYMGAALADGDKALKYCIAAGERALRLLAFEEAVGHFTRGLEVAELYGDHDLTSRCDALLALAEALNKAGDATEADRTYEKAAAVARSMEDSERLALAALRAGPLSYTGIVGANADQVRLLEEARSKLSEADSHLRVMVTARLGLVMVYAAGIPEPGLLRRAQALSTDAVAMARRLGDRNALGYALNARFHALWGIDPAPERLAVGTELVQIADDVGDELLALHGHMWRVRELLAQGDVDGVNEEIRRFEARDNGPAHPLAGSYACNVRAMMALVNGDFEEGARLGPIAMELAEGYNDLAMSFYGALMAWTWWQQDQLVPLEGVFREVIDQAPADYPVVRAALALLYSEKGQRDDVLAELDRLAELGWEAIAHDQTEGVSLAMVAAACGAARAADHATALYEHLRPYAGTAIVIRAPAAACYGPADQYLGLLASAMGDLALAEVHFEAALRLARRMRSQPFVAAAEVELARTMRQRGHQGDEERVAALLRSAEESARRMGLSRIARMAAAPG
jgi:DNA-binding SARP family transcriptional activator/tetratricopeptide (TPR) repeat protein